ncbi:unnamed protein product [Linum tenue]|uniref:Uncharacterized protein n=1 Tax=Linum tenue TaxID=586396 RepID=A0AAV0PZ47_9ROSI|nr:unnamed protein product [Linum tenue]
MSQSSPQSARTEC